MVTRQPWFERRFTFDLPATAAPGLVERLRGTPARLAERVAGLPADRLTARDGAHWSIQEHVGHLGDLEPLWLGRLDDFAAGRPLRPADLQNRQTHEANHNARSLTELLAVFREARRALVARLDAAGEADWLATGLHPRLQVPMRLLDHALFVAEHDDHHLAIITELLREGG